MAAQPSSGQFSATTTVADSTAIRVVGNGTAMSTPTSDTKAVPATGNELEIALHLLESESAAFARSVIADPAARADYTRSTRAATAELLDMVRQRKITPHEAAQAANAMRNQIMSLARSKLTDFGLAVSREMKADGLVLPALQEKYAIKRFGRRFSSLGQTERELVWVDIVHAAGRSNPAVNIRVKWFGMAGRSLLIASLACAVYNVATAENRGRQVAKESSSFAAGAAGGALATATVVALASNPAGWVIGIAMFVGAAVGAAGSSELFDYFWPER